MPEDISTTSLVKKGAFATLLVVLGIVTINVQPGAAAATSNNFLKVLRSHQVLKANDVTDNATKAMVKAVPKNIEILQILKSNQALKMKSVQDNAAKGSVPISASTFSKILKMNQGLNVNSGIVNWSPQPAASENSDTTSECSAELAACSEDTDCNNCMAGADDSTCDDTLSTCSEFVDHFCCYYGDSCNDNPLLVAYVDCVGDDISCGVETDLCDTQDDNGTLTVSDDEECPSEWTACNDDTACQACMAGYDDTCSGDENTCNESAAVMCCGFGGMDGCSDNALVMEYVNCHMTPCEFTDFCDHQTPAPTPTQVVCVSETSDCMDSAVCTQCFEDFFATDDDNTDDTIGDDTSTAVEFSCVDINDAVCEVYGPSATCTSNDEYEAFTECVFESVIEDCTIDLCEATATGDAATDDGPSSGSIFGCPDESDACVESDVCFECLSALFGDSADDDDDDDDDDDERSCDETEAFFCESAAATDTCLNNDEYVAWVECVAQTGSDCEIDVTCSGAMVFAPSGVMVFLAATVSGLLAVGMGMA